MKIVSVTPIEVERDSRTFKQAASFARLGHESIVVEWGASHDRTDYPFELISARRDGGLHGRRAAPPGGTTTVTASPRRPVERLPGRLGSMASAIGALAGTIALRARLQRQTFRATPKADLYILHSYVQFPAVWLRCRRSRARFVYDAHDFYSVLALDGRRTTTASRVIARLDERLERACIDRAAAVMTVSVGLAELIAQRFGRTPAVIRNTHDVRLDRAPRVELREEAGVPADAFLLVVAGNWKRGMAVESALRALSALPARVHMAWVGAGYERWTERARGLGVEDRAHFLLPVPPAEVRGFIAGADVGLVLYHPVTVSHRSALPNGFFHSVAAGLPILYPRSLPELADLAEQHGLGRPIDPCDPRSITKAVEELMASPECVVRLKRRVAGATSALSWQQEEPRLAALASAELAEPRIA